MNDGYCGPDRNYSNNDNYTCNNTVAYENTSIPNQDVIYSSNVVVENNTEHFYIGDCPTIYDGGFQPARVGLEMFSIGGGGGGVVQPCYDPGIHTISYDVGGLQPCYVEPPVYPIYPTDTTIPEYACCFIFIILFILLAIFVVMGEFRIYLSKYLVLYSKFMFKSIFFSVSVLLFIYL